MANKDNVSVNRDEFHKLKSKLAESYKTGYRAGLENGFKQGVDIVIKTMTDLKQDDIIKRWCDCVMEGIEEN